MEDGAEEGIQSGDRVPVSSVFQSGSVTLAARRRGGMG